MTAPLDLDHRPQADLAPSPSAPISGYSRPGPRRKDLAVAGPPFNRQAIALCTLVIIGATIRLRGLTSGGLRTSDAWVGITSKVSWGQAWHMLANAPGFYLFERVWVELYPSATWWGQLPALIMGIASIPAIYYLFRYLRFDTWLQLSAALVVAVSPICIIYSTRYKEYSADFLLACLLIALGERTRRHWRRRDICLLAAATVLSFAVSGSTIPVTAGVWLVVGAATQQHGRRPRDLMLPAGVALTVCLAIDEIFYRHLSPYLNRDWSHNFFSHASPLAYIDSVSRLLLSLYQGMTGSVLNGALVFLLLTGLAVVGCINDKSRSATLAIAAAFGACTLHAIPLGTGRTDEVLYPAFLVLIACGLQGLTHWFRNTTPRTPWHRWCTVGIGLTLGGVLLITGVATDNHYDAKDIQPLAAQVNGQLRPGDHVVVDAMLRYTWALYEEQSPHIVLGSQWMTGFSVASTSPSTFIVPSFPGEGGWTPGRWIDQLAHYQRLWVLEPSYSAHPSTSPQLGTFYLDLHRAGWTAIRSIDETGCMAILLQRA
jgi:hypothetical protein